MNKKVLTEKELEERLEKGKHLTQEQFLKRKRITLEMLDSSLQKLK